MFLIRENLFFYSSNLQICHTLTLIIISQKYVHKLLILKTVCQFLVLQSIILLFSSFETAVLRVNSFLRILCFYEDSWIILKCHQYFRKLWRCHKYFVQSALEIWTQRIGPDLVMCLSHLPWPIVLYDQPWHGESLAIDRYYELWDEKQVVRNVKFLSLPVLPVEVHVKDIYVSSRF